MPTFKNKKAINLSKKKLSNYSKNNVMMKPGIFPLETMLACGKKV